MQHKTVDTLATELDLPSSQLLGLFNRLMRRSVQYLNSILEDDVEQTLAAPKDVVMTPVAKSMNQELEEAAQVCVAYHGNLSYNFIYFNSIFRNYKRSRRKN